MNSPLGGNGYGPIALPWSYIPDQLLARLPGAFLFLLAVAFISAIGRRAVLVRRIAAAWRDDRSAGLRTALMTVARARAGLIVAAAVILPLSFLIIQRATVYNGIRHVLFVIPMLAVLAAGAGWRALLPLLRRVPIVAAIVAGAYAGSPFHTRRSSPPSLGAPMPAASSPPWPRCIRSNMWR